MSISEWTVKTSRHSKRWEKKKEQEKELELQSEREKEREQLLSRRARFQDEVKESDPPPLVSSQSISSSDETGSDSVTPRQLKKIAKRKKRKNPNLIEDEEELVAFLRSCILREPKGFTTVSALGTSVQEVTKASWNKGYKSRFGAMVKFLYRRSDSFVLRGEEVYISNEISQSLSTSPTVSVKLNGRTSSNKAKSPNQSRSNSSKLASSGAPTRAVNKKSGNSNNNHNSNSNKSGKKTSLSVSQPGSKSRCASTMAFLAVGVISAGGVFYLLQNDLLPN